MNPLERLTLEFADLTQAELRARWEAWPIDFKNIEAHECCGALLARQVTLTNQIVRAPTIWNGHVAPVLLRCMADVFIALAWISKDPLERSRKFIHHGLGQLKLELEHRKSQLDESANKDLEKLIIESLESWANSQKFQEFTEVDLGSWAGKSTRSMAEEAGELDFYRYVYTPFSAPVHASWHHIARYNLTDCESALHRHHRIPIDPDLGIDPNYAYLAAKYLDKTYKLFDETFGVERVDTPSLDFIRERLVEMMREDSEDTESSS